jgi:hypothetical protein
MAGQQVRAVATITRPGDTTAYAVGDVVTSATPVAMTFAGVCRVNGGSGYLVGALLATDQSTNVAAFRANFHISAPPTPVADNAANVRLWANNSIRLGHMDFPAMTTGTGSNTAAVSEVNDSRIPYQCGAGTTSISGTLEVSTAFTPANAQNFELDLMAMPN